MGDIKKKRIIQKHQRPDAAVNDPISEVLKRAERKQYLVEGARLMCTNGDSTAELKIPEGHGYYSGGRKKANCKDCAAVENIPCFGSCSKNERTHQCEGFMDLAEKWVNTKGSSISAEQIDGEAAITMTSALLCKKGGIILPVTSGQGYNGALDWEAFQKHYQKVKRWAAGKDLLCRIYEKDPINMNTGSYIYEKEDLVSGGKMPLSFKMFYNSMDCGEQGDLGSGWSHNFGVCLKQGEGGVMSVILEDGKEVPYRRRLDEEYLPLMGDAGTLKKSGDGYVYERGTLTYVFSGDGKLLRQTDANGNSRYFRYDADGLLKRVENSAGSFLVYTHNEEKNLIEVEDHTGRKVNLWYQYGKLRWFINSSGYTCTYEYNVNGILDSILTPRGVLGLKNEYDGVDRVVKQTTPDGGVVELCHDDKNNRTYIREQNGSVVVYESDERMRNIRTIYKDGEETFAYNDRNQRIRYTDKNGNTTKYSYDNRGNICQIIYPDGEKRSMTYDAEGHLLTLSVNGVQKRKNLYDGKGNLIRSADALGRSVEIEYDENGNAVTFRMPDKSTALLEYDSRGNICSVTDGEGVRTGYEYDACSRVIRTTDGNGNQTAFTYDAANRITSVTNAEGNRRFYTYTRSGKLEKLVDFNGAVTENSYNAMNQVESRTLPDKETIRMEYDRMQNLSKILLPNGAQLMYLYDRRNRLEQIVLPTGGIIRYEYDPNGNRTGVVDPEGNRTVMEYDERNRLIRTTDPSGAATEYGYDTKGNRIRVTDAAGNSCRYEYDAAGQLIFGTDVPRNINRYAYDAMGRIACVTDPKGRRTLCEYGKNGKLSRKSAADGTVTCYEYDRNGNLILQRDPGGRQLKYTYDCLNRLVSVQNHAGQEKRYNYDAVGNVTSVTDALGHVTRYEYSPGGRLTSVVDADGNRTEYAYDAMGSLTVVCRHEGMKRFLDSQGRLSLPEGYPEDRVRLTRYERGPSGAVETMIDPLGQKEHYTVDLSGRISARTDRDGYVTRYAYNPFGDMERITYADGRSVSFTYNALRQLIQIQDWLGITRIEPDPAGRVRKVTDAMGREVSYRWGTMGEREQITSPDGRRVSYEYDERSRLSRLSDGEQEVRYAYDPEGRLTEKTGPDHICTSYRYNSMGYLESLVHQRDGSILEKYEYEYDLSGNRTAVRRERRVSPLVSDGIPADVKEQVYRDNGMYRYQYDDLYRLIEVRKDGVCIRQYEYDAFGNRTRKVEENQQTCYFYNAADQLIREEGDFAERTYQYDARGNLTAVLHGTSVEHQYAYDATGRLSLSMNAEGRVARYQYNGLGQRTGIQEYTLTGFAPETPFSADAITCADPVREVEYLLDLTRPYHNLIEKSERDEGRASVQSYIWDTNTAFLKEEKATHIYLQDELGSPVRLVQSGGKRQTLYGYDEFGNDRYGNQGELQPFGYTGYRRDRTAGSYFAQAREYLPGPGRFAGEDINKGTIMKPGSLNDYSYCLGNPLLLVDQNGRSPVPSPADAQRMMWDYCVDQYHDALDAIKDEWDSRVDAVVECGKAHEDEIKIGVTGVAIAGSSIAAGTGIGLPAAAIVMGMGSTGALMGGQYYEENGMNGADGFMRGGMNATVIAMGMVTNPTAAFLGIGCQIATDITQEEYSSPESYTGSVIGAIIGANYGSAMGAGMATAVGKALEKMTAGLGESWLAIGMDAMVVAGLGKIANYMVQTVLPWDLAFYLGTALSEETLNWIENIMSGIENAAYGEILNCMNAD